MCWISTLSPIWLAVASRTFSSLPLWPETVRSVVHGFVCGCMRTRMFVCVCSNIYACACMWLFSSVRVCAQSDTSPNKQVLKQLLNGTVVVLRTCLHALLFSP